MTPSPLLLLIQCLLALTALTTLCLATKRHIPQIPFATTHPKRWCTPLRTTGSAMLLLNAIIAVNSRGWGLGLVDLLGALTLAAFIVISTATYFPRGLMHLAPASFIVSIWILLIL